MKILWESDDWPGAKIEPAITHLAWLPQYDKDSTIAERGLLGVGTESGSVGITLTDLKPPVKDDATRYNFNLRGHHTAIRIVSWNSGQTKLASCDSSGIIYVWVKNDDRWSVELVNDRGVKVSDLSWSPCGTHALICYEDNFVLIGSASGQRVWSNSFPTGPNNQVTCGCWSPDSRQLVVGFSNGAIHVLSNQGTNITERTFTDDKLQQMAYSAIRKDETSTLAMLTSSNKIFMVTSYDDLSAKVYRSPFHVIYMQWNSQGTLLALINSNHELIMLDINAVVIHRERITIAKADKPLTAFTWAHDGNAVIVAAGGHLAVGRLMFGVPALFDLVSYNVWKMMGRDSKNARKLPIPVREIAALKEFDHHIIRCRIPRTNDLCQYVCSVVDARCYCTIRPMARGSHTYVLCIEHLGGLVPVLIGRQVNRFLPQFQIYLYHNQCEVTPNSIPGSSAQVEDVNSFSSHSNARNSLWRRSKRQIRALMSRHVRPPRTDTRLVQVASNVWCTKFTISSMAPTVLPQFLGQVVYKTSVLHLQPRQMTIELTVMSNDKKNDKDDQKEAKKVVKPIEKVSTHPSRTERGLTKEERQFFEKILSECLTLRAAMDSASIEANRYQPSTSTSVSRLCDSPDLTRTTPLSVRTTDSRLEITSMVSTVSTWHEEIETLAYIDNSGLCGTTTNPLAESSSTQSTTSGVVEQAPGNERRASAPPPALPLPTSVSHPPPPPPTPIPVKTASWPTDIASKKDADAIRMHVDKLATIAEQLSKRHVDFNAKKDKASINKMRSQMKELLRRVHEIEKKVSSSDVKLEVRQLMKTLEEMKRALGESGSVAKTGTYRTAVMHNKTPFWNEHNQVYQLDFGGRVTQESAKNFQIELDDKQVLQFGRIEGGAYTLDFRQPFSASQAFAVALASITQRLK